jgi:2-(1,2-epoxy-1,2-dihydrophenyl)acetyl-CoA isomerase
MRKNIDLIKERSVMAYKKIIYTKENHIATVTLNRPEVLNALDFEIEEELGQAISEVRSDDDVRVLIITGAGRAFCSGRDQKAGAGSPPPQQRGPMVIARGSLGDPGGPWTNDIDLWNLPQPVIAAVNGVAVGGGLNIALSCDIIAASEKASFGEFFIRRGLIASGCGTWLLPRLIGVHKAKQLLFFGELLNAKEAEKIGLVNYVFPADEFEAKVRELAEKIARAPAKAMSMMKKLVNNGLTMDIDAAGRAEKFIDDEVLMPFFTDDIAEGRKSFVEKRAPQFKGAAGEREWSEKKYK